MKKTIFLIILFFLCAQTAGAADTVFDDDVYVQGNECVGADCPAGGSPFLSSLGNTTLWLNDSAPQIFMRDPDTGAVDFAILVDNSEFGIYNEDTEARLLGIDATGTIQAEFEDSNAVGDGLTVLYDMSADNQDGSKRIG